MNTIEQRIEALASQTNDPEQIADLGVRIPADLRGLGSKGTSEAHAISRSIRPTCRPVADWLRGLVIDELRRSADEEEFFTPPAPIRADQLTDAELAAGNQHLLLASWAIEDEGLLRIVRHLLLIFTAEVTRRLDPLKEAQ